MALFNSVLLLESLEFLLKSTFLSMKSNELSEAVAQHFCAETVLNAGSRYIRAQQTVYIELSHVVCKGWTTLDEIFDFTRNVCSFSKYNFYWGVPYPLNLCLNFSTFVAGKRKEPSERCDVGYPRASRGTIFPTAGSAEE